MGKIINLGILTSNFDYYYNDVLGLYQIIDLEDEIWTPN